jgi:hypothetical protein
VEKQPQETGPHTHEAHTHMYTLQKSLQNLQMKSAQQWYIYIYICVLWMTSVLLVGFLREKSIFLGEKKEGVEGVGLIEHLKINCFWFFSPNKRKGKTTKHPTLHLYGVF